MITKEEWKRRVEVYKNSGMSQSAWCQSEGIASSKEKHLFKIY